LKEGGNCAVLLISKGGGGRILLIDQLASDHFSQMIPFCGDVLGFLLTLDSQSWEYLYDVFSAVLDSLDVFVDFGSIITIFFAGLLFLQSLLITTS
jgi:NAD kinase